MKYKGIIFALVLPLYAVMFFNYQMMTMWFTEYFDQLMLAKNEEENTIDDAKYSLLIWEILFGISLVLLAAQIANAINQQGSRYLGNLYSIIDLVFMT